MRCLSLLRRLAECHRELPLFSVAEDRQGDSVARLMVAQGAEEVPEAYYSGMVQGRDYVPPAHPGFPGWATRYDLHHQRARVYGQVEPSGVLGAKVCRQHAEVRSRDLPLLDKLVRHRDRRVRRDGEAEVYRPGLGRRGAGDVDTDDLATSVGQGAAGVARRDRCVGLDKVSQGAPLRSTAARQLGGELAAHAAHHAGGYSRLETRRAAYGYRELAHDGCVSILERGSRQVVAVRLYHGDLGVRIGTDYACLFDGAVGEGHVHAGGPFDDVVVGDDVAVGAVDHTAA